MKSRRVRVAKHVIYAGKRKLGGPSHRWVNTMDLPEKNKRG